MATVQQRTRRRRTNSLRTHRISLVLAAVSAVLGLVLVVVGVVAWSMGRPTPRQLLDGQATTIGRTPWFDAGTTLFAAPSDEDVVPGPSALGCTLHTPDGDRRLRSGADPEQLGTRVVADISLVPVVTVGPTTAADRVVCDGPAMEDAVVWALPTDAGPSRYPLSIVIAGVALVGLATLVDPRARGLRRGLG